MQCRPIQVWLAWLPTPALKPPHLRVDEQFKWKCNWKEGQVSFPKSLPHQCESWQIKDKAFEEVEIWQELFKIDRKKPGGKNTNTESYPVQWDSGFKANWAGHQFPRMTGTVPGHLVWVPCRIKFCSNVQMFKFYYQYGSCFQAIKIYLIKPSMCIKVLIIKKTDIQGMVALHIYKKKNTLMNRKLNTKVN